MANTYNALFRGAASVGSTTLYTVPSNTKTMVTVILVVNTSSSAQTFSLSLDGVSIATAVPISANDTKPLEIKQILAAGKTITGLASATSVNFHISGLEMV